MTDTIREAFEQWYDDIYGLEGSKNHFLMYIAWQAAWKAQAESAQKGAVKPITIFTGEPE